MGSVQSADTKCDINSRSPIDLPDVEPECDKTTYPSFVTFKYTETSFRVTRPPNSSQTELDVFSSESHVMYNRDRYDLVGMRIQVPSDHSFGRVRYPMELQMRHRNSAGDTLMVSFMIRISPEADESTHHDRKELLSQFLVDSSRESTVTLELYRIINKAHTGFYYYDGSSTGQRECSKATWIVFSRAIGLPLDVVQKYVSDIFPEDTPSPRHVRSAASEVATT